MSDLTGILKANGFFILGYFYTIISQWMFPPLIDAVEDLIGTNVAGILWTGLWITWVLAIIIIPLALMIQALTTKLPSANPLINTTTGILWSLFTLMLVIAGWYMTTGLTDILRYELLKVLFWVGTIIIIIIGNVIVVPAYMIIESKKNA